MPSPISDSDSADVIAIQREADTLLEEVNNYFGQELDAASRPDVLLHFTDATGFLGILQSRKLWASLATALNDTSETSLAVQLIEHSESMAGNQWRHLEPELVRTVARGEVRSVYDEWANDCRSYVTSLCARDAAVHWLHYGWRGKGVALALDAAMLAEVPQFTLVDVLYDTERQRARLNGIGTLVDTFLNRCLACVAQDLADALRLFAANLFVRYVRLMAPQMKHSAFRAEDEWRLVSNEAWVRRGQPTEGTRQTKFRWVENRIVPYKEVEIPAAAIRGITLGANCPLRESDQALQVLLEECLGGPIPVTRSSIPVR